MITSDRLRNLFQRLFHDKTLKNASWLIGEQIFQMLLSFVISVLSARYLGPSDFGALNYTASFVAFFTSIASVGLEGVVLKKIIEHPDKEGEYLGNAIVLRLFSALLSAITVSIIVYALNPSSLIKLLLTVLQSIQLVFKAFQILDSWFQRFLMVKYVAIGKMIASILVSGYKLFLLVSAKSLIWFALSNTLTDLIISIVILCCYHKVKNQNIRFTFSHSMELLREGYHFILSGILSALYTQMDRIMIGQMLTDSDVGLYSIALTVCSLWMFIPNAFINSFRPRIIETHATAGTKKYLKSLKQLYSGVIWMSAAASFCIVLFSGLIVKILYGAEYMGAVDVIMILAWSEIFALLGTAREIWILCEDKSKYVKYYLAIGASVNLLLNALLIPVFGMIGAAIATLITQIVTCLVAPLCYKETRTHTKLVIDAFIFKWK